MKLPPLHPFSRRYLLPGESPKNSLERLIISLDPRINLQSLLDGSIQSSGGSIENAVFDGLSKRLSLAKLVKLIEAHPELGDDPSLGSTGFGSDEDDCVVQDQPDGELLDPEMIEKLENEMELPREEISPKDAPQNSKSPEDAQKDPEKCKSWRMEKLAWYASAHRNEIRDYGIHIRVNGVAKTVQRLEEIIVANSHLPQDKKILIFAVFFKFYAHELCHAWVEDLCSLIDFIHEEKGHRGKRRYALTLDRFHAYIFLEEALCNTAAYGLLHDQLHAIHDNKASGYSAATPDFDPDVILNAFEHLMRGQPNGYRDFKAIQQKPQESQIFKSNLCRLLQEPRIFGYPQDRLILGDVIEGFFNNTSENSLDLAGWVTGCKYAPPVYTVLKGREGLCASDEYRFRMRLSPNTEKTFNGLIACRTPRF